MLARGNAPGDQKDKNTCALKGPNRVSDLVRWITFLARDLGVDLALVTPFQGCADWCGSQSPGRCPGLSCHCPFGAKTQSCHGVRNPWVNRCRVGVVRVEQEAQEVGEIILDAG
jgi:hypothetical protein